MPALRPAIAHTRSATSVKRYVVFEIALAGGTPAGRTSAGSVPDLGQVPQQDARIMTCRLMPVVTFVSGNRPDRNHQVGLSRISHGQPPSAVPAGRSGPIGRGGREPWFAWVWHQPCRQRRPVPVSGEGDSAGAGGSTGWIMISGRPRLLLFHHPGPPAAGFGPGASTSNGVSLRIRHGKAPGGPRVPGSGAGQVAGQPRVSQYKSKYT